MGSGILMFMLVVLCVFLVIAGLLIFVRGVRGKRVGLTPHCRRCDFDLSGNAGAKELLLQAMDASAQNGDPRCPECGAKLRAGDSIRIGSFRRGWVRAILGAVVMATGLVLLSSGVIGLTSTAASSKWAQSAPLWVLHWQLRSGNQSAVDATSREILRRDQAGTLQSADAASLMNGVLDAMARKEIAWSSSLVNARDALEFTRGTPLADHEWGRLMDRLIDKVTIQARPVVREGKKLPSRALVKIASGAKDDLRLNGRLVGLKIDDESQSLPQNYGVSGFGLHESPNRDLKFDHLIPITASEGKHRVELEWELSLSRNTTASLCSKTFKDVLDIEVVSKDAQLIGKPAKKTINDVKRLLSVSRVDIWNSGGFGATSGMVQVSTSTDDFPAAFDIYVLVPSETANPTQFLASTLILKSGMYIMPDINLRSNALWSKLSSLGRVDVLLRANPELAEQTLDLTECVEGEILFKDVPVQVPTWAPPAPKLTPTSSTNAFLLNAIASNFPAYMIREVTRSPEADTLIERIKAKKVTDEEARTILDTLLALQSASGDEQRWTLECGTVIEELMLAGKATEENSNRYYSQIATSINLMPPVRAWEGKDSYVTVTILPYRCAEQSDITMEMNPTAIRVDGKNVPVTEPPIKRHLMGDGWRVGLSNQFIQRSIKLPAFEKDGDHTVEIDYRVRAWKGGVDQIEVGTLLHEKTQTLKVTFPVLAKDDPGITLLKDENTRRSLIECFSAQNSTANVMTDSVGKVDFGGAINISAAIGLSLVFDVFVRPVDAADASQDVPAGFLMLQKGTYNNARNGMHFGTHRNYNKLLHPMDPPAWLNGAKQVMLVLRANPERAANSYRDRETWAGEDILIGPVTLTRGRVSE